MQFCQEMMTVRIEKLFTVIPAREFQVKEVSKLGRDMRWTNENERLYELNFLLLQSFCK